MAKSRNRSPRRSTPRHHITMASTAKPPDPMSCALAALLFPESRARGCPSRSGSRSGSRQGYAPSHSSSSHRGSHLPASVQNAFAELHAHLSDGRSDTASVNSYRSSHTSFTSTDDTAEETAPKKRGNGDGTLRPLKLGSIDSVDTGSAFETIVPQTYRVQQPQ